MPPTATTAARSTPSWASSAPARASRDVTLLGHWGDAGAPRGELAVEPVVTLLGGEYCFLPSIDFLRGLDQASTAATLE